MKPGISGSLTTAALLAFGSSIGAAQPSSQAICSMAASYFGAGGVPASTELLLMSESLSERAQWTPLAANSDTPFSKPTHTVYLAYFFSGPYVVFFNGPGSARAGVLSVKASVSTAVGNPRTSSVELHRPAIPPGADRCEPRGLPRIEERHVSINEYIDYHKRTGNSSGIEDFHFQYPFGISECAHTDRPQDVAATFQFENVKPTPSTTVVARLFGTGSALAADENTFSHLRSELHYYSSNGTTPMCVGFQVAVNS
jgi:hypothetical protein